MKSITSPPAFPAFRGQYTKSSHFPLRTELESQFLLQSLQLQRIFNMEDLTKYNSQWVEFHIRDHIKDGEILVQNTVIEGYL